MEKNSTDASVSAAIDRLQEALEQARQLPNWSVAVIILIALLCFIVLLHLLALVVASPWLWLMYRRRRGRERVPGAAPGDEILDPDVDLELVSHVGGEKTV